MSTKKTPLSISGAKFLVPKAGLEPARGITTHDFESCASANSATSAPTFSLYAVLRSKSTIEIQFELQRMRPQIYGIDFVPTLVIDPSRQEVFTEHAAFEQKVMVGL